MFSCFEFLYVNFKYHSNECNKNSVQSSLPYSELQTKFTS